MWLHGFNFGLHLSLEKKKWMISLFLDLYSFYLFKAVLAAIWQAYIWNSYHRLSSSLQFIKWLSVDVRVLIQNPEKSMEKFPFNLISSCLSSSYIWDSVVGKQAERTLTERKLESSSLPMPLDQRKLDQWVRYGEITSWEGKRILLNEWDH